jgi:hypothetical protein
LRLDFHKVFRFDRVHPGPTRVGFINQYYSAREEAEMLSKCANPGCAATFLYLHQGKLFRVDTSVEAVAGIPAAATKKPSRRVEFFWLCDQCAAEVTLGYKRGTGITVVPLPKVLKRAASAS